MTNCVLHIDPVFRNQRDKSTGRFVRGMTPWNKHKNHSAGGRSSETRFLKGHSPHNTKPDGYEALRMDNSKYPYIYIKADGKMISKHRWIWEKHNGPIPRNCIITFKDGNHMNCAIYNLEMITKRENAIRNANIQKRSETLRILYSRERIRKIYQLPALSGLYKRLVNF